MKISLKYRNLNEAVSDISLGLLEPNSPLHKVPIFKNTSLEDRKDILNAINKVYNRIHDVKDLEFIVNHYTCFTGVEIRLGLKEVA